MQAAHATFAVVMNDVILLLGSNEGDRAGWLRFALKEIGKRIGTIEVQSSVYETAAWGNTDQPSFLNMAVKVNTNLTAEELLAQTQDIEAATGRNRDVKWGQRTLDIDILFYSNEIIETENLSIPHPYLHERKFALAPLVEIEPNLVHPLLQQTISQLYKDCKDELPVTKLNALSNL